MSEQLLLFHFPKSDIEELNDEMENLVEKLDRNRKCMHAKISTLSTQVRTLECRVDLLEVQLYILRGFIEKYMTIREEMSLSINEDENNRRQDEQDRQRQNP